MKQNQGNRNYDRGNRLEPTYKELKPVVKRYRLKFGARLEPTYKELKPALCQE
ncbi:MAG: hypothetical protein CH6_1075 [Candidatus Kapaibacterium sp.]|nr:MAG: hypothetical protein CH6_1075 [Candidatus Kapabacteria bacterium]